jgi:hypothetical protein
MTTQEHQPVTDVHEEPQAADEQHAGPADATTPRELVDESPSAAVDSPPGPETASLEKAASAEQPLFADEELADLRARWTAVQAAFVDDPKDCVHRADGLVSDLVEQLTTGFGRARSRLEEQWARGEEASTEDLRVALMHYREFFDRLLAV